MNKPARGFTLIELIVVIVVVAILATIGVVAYGGIQERAHEAAIVSDMRQVSNAIELYEMEKGYYPHSTVAAADDFDNSKPLRIELNTMGLSVSHGSYSRDHSNGLFISNTSGDKWAFLAAPKKAGLTTFQMSP